MSQSHSNSLVQFTGTTVLSHFINVILPFAVLSVVLYTHTKAPKNLISVFVYSIVIVFFYTLLLWFQGLNGVLINIAALCTMVVFIVLLCTVFWFMHNAGDTGVLTSDRAIRFGTYLLVAFGAATITVWTMKGLSFVWPGMEHIIRFWAVPVVLHTSSLFAITQIMFIPNGISHTDYSLSKWFFMEMVKQWVGYGLVSQYIMSVEN